MTYYYTFCIHEDCPNTDCKRHIGRIPILVPVSVSQLPCSRKEGAEDSYYEKVDTAR